MQLTSYAAPALLALLAKAGILLYARRTKVHNLQTQIYLLFLLSLSIQNVAEVFAFDAHAKGLLSPPAGKSYFAASILAIAFLLHLALVTSTSSRTARESLAILNVVLIYTPAVILEALLWLTPLLVAGFQPMGYTYTKVPGPLYFWFEIYAVAYPLATIALLLYGWRIQTTPFRRLQNQFFLLGIFPWVALVLTIVVLQHIGFRGFNSTITLPIAITFFLAVTAYATHQYRLFDIEFFIPWSKVRKRKTEFYRRIQKTIAAIAELRSVEEMVQLIASTLSCQVALIGGPRPVAALPENYGQSREGLSLFKFPRSTLEKVEQIVVAQEITESNTELHRVMEKYKVGAIVPFKSHSTVASHWLVLGDHFSHEVYTPLDFKLVEELFGAMADRFLDDFLEVRYQLKDTEKRLRWTMQHVGLTWHKEELAKKDLEAIETENRALLLERERLRRKQAEATEPAAIVPGGISLDEYLNKCEREALISALDHCHGNKTEAAQLLGISLIDLESLAIRHGIDQSRWMVR